MPNKILNSKHETRNKSEYQNPEQSCFGRMMVGKDMNSPVVYGREKISIKIGIGRLRPFKMRTYRVV